MIDPVGGQVRTDSFQVMAPLGRMLLVGNASGDWQHIVATNDLWFRSLAIAGFSAGYYFPAHPGQAQAAARGAINAILQGLVDIRTQVFPLAEAAAAQRRAEAGSVAGRILLAALPGAWTGNRAGRRDRAWSGYAARQCARVGGR